jgi:hypothetical protein
MDYPQALEIIMYKCKGRLLGGLETRELLAHTYTIHKIRHHLKIKCNTI